MFIDFNLTYCKDCDTIDQVICDVDGTLAQYGKNQYDNLRFLTNKYVPRDKSHVLFYYKDILENLKWNPNFYYPFCIDDILSHIRGIIGGQEKIQRRVKFTTSTTTTTSTTSGLR